MKQALLDFAKFCFGITAVSLIIYGLTAIAPRKPSQYDSVRLTCKGIMVRDLSQAGGPYACLKGE